MVVIESDRLAVGEDADRIVAVAHHLARFAVEGDEMFTFTVGIGLVHDAHGLQLSGVLVDEGALVVQPRHGLRHAFKLAQRIVLPGRQRQRVQEQQQADGKRGQGHRFSAGAQGCRC